MIATVAMGVVVDVAVGALALVAVAVGMAMSMAVIVPVVMAGFLLNVLEPEFGDRVADDAADVADARKDVAQVVLNVAVEAQKEDLGGGAHEGHGAGEDEHCDQERGDRVPAGPACQLDEDRGNDDRHRAEGVGENVQVDALHVLTVGVGAGCGFAALGRRRGGGQ